jgi:hypothetical protein
MANRDPETLIILAPGTTDSVQTDVFKVRRGEEVTIMLYPEANLGADTGTLQKLDPAGTWVNCTDDNGDITLSTDRTMEVVVGLGTYRLNIATRTGSWGVAIDR